MILCDGNIGRPQCELFWLWSELEDHVWWRTQSIHCLSLLKLPKKNQLCVLMHLTFICHKSLRAPQLRPYSTWQINSIGADTVVNKLPLELWISAISNRTFLNNENFSMLYKMAANSHLWRLHTGNMTKTEKLNLTTVLYIQTVACVWQLPCWIVQLWDLTAVLD